MLCRTNDTGTLSRLAKQSADWVIAPGLPQTGNEYETLITTSAGGYFSCDPCRLAHTHSVSNYPAPRISLNSKTPSHPSLPTHTPDPAYGLMTLVLGEEEGTKNSVSHGKGEAHMLNVTHNGVPV